MPLQAETWARVKELFHAAADLAPGERPAFLDRACNGDAALRSEVESLLHADETSDTFLETPPHNMPAGELSENR